MYRSVHLLRTTFCDSGRIFVLTFLCIILLTTVLSQQSPHLTGSNPLLILLIFSSTVSGHLFTVAVLLDFCRVFVDLGATVHLAAG